MSLTIPELLIFPQEFASTRIHLQLRICPVLCFCPHFSATELRSVWTINAINRRGKTGEPMSHSQKTSKEQFSFVVIIVVAFGQEHIRASTPTYSNLWPLANPLFARYPLTMTCKLTAIIEQDKDGVFAYCPELKGCHTQGQTVEEALANLREAAELYVETLKPAELRRLGDKIILATSLEIAHA
jgi:predicted RNase H-like HicB family nuclease